MSDLHDKAQKYCNHPTASRAAKAIIADLLAALDLLKAQYGVCKLDADGQRKRVDALLAENERLQAKLNTPETENFLQGVRFEVAHQVERWGTVHDRAKQPADWFWLVGYLSGKALAAHIAGDRDKALHHCISTAAVLANWHTHVLVGSGSFTPGSSDLQRFLTDTFGAEVPRG